MISWYVLVPLAAVITFVGAVGALFFKKAAKDFSLHPLKLIRNKNFILAAAIYTFASVAYVFVLKFEDLIIMYPLGSLQYVWAALLSAAFLHEKLNNKKWAGIGLIMIGVTIITVFR